MSRFSPIEGTVTSISDFPFGNSASACTLLFSVQTIYGETYSVVLNPNTYVLNQAPIRQGDRIIAFYDTLAPMPLIYPPQYQAVVIVKPARNQYAMLDTFDQNLRNSDNSLVLNLSTRTNIRTQNGQIYPGRLGGQLLLVLYSATTRSIPAQTTPDTIVVFCSVS